MNIEKYRQVIKKYKDMYDNAGLKPVKHYDITLAIDYKQEIQHCRWMLDEMEKMLEDAENPYVYDTDAKIAKINRWLGFIQGVMWAQSMFTIDQLKEDNRSNV